MTGLKSETEFKSQTTAPPHKKLPISFSFSVEKATNSTCVFLKLLNLIRLQFSTIKGYRHGACLWIRNLEGTLSIDNGGWFIGFQRGQKTLSGTGLEVIWVIFWQRIWRHIPYDLNSRLLCLAKYIPKIR